MTEKLNIRILWVITLPLKVFIVFYLVLFCVSIKNYFGYDIYLTDNYTYSCAHNFNVIRDDLNISNPGTSMHNVGNIGYNEKYIFGDNAYHKRRDEKFFFVIDLSKKIIIYDQDIDKLCEKSGLNRKSFESTYLTSFCFHYNRLIGEMSK